MIFSFSFYDGIYVYVIDSTLKTIICNIQKLNFSFADNIFFGHIPMCSLFFTYIYFLIKGKLWCRCIFPSNIKRFKCSYIEILGEESITSVKVIETRWNLYDMRSWRKYSSLSFVFLLQNYNKINIHTHIHTVHPPTYIQSHIQVRTLRHYICPHTYAGTQA